MNKITVDLENLSDNERKQLLALIEKSNSNKEKIWKPDPNEKYYFISSNGNVLEAREGSINIINSKYELNNCFKTYEEAQFSLERLKIQAKLWQLARASGEIDWDNINENKYVFIWNQLANRIDVMIVLYSQLPFVPYFATKESARAAIEEIGEDKIKKYLFNINN